MLIRRLVKANDINVNLGTNIIGLEDALKDYIKNNHVLLDDNESIYDKAYNKNNPCLLLPIINPARVIGVVYDVDDEYFHVDLTSFGEDLIGDNEDDLFKIGVVSKVDLDYTDSEDNKWYCKGVIRLYLCNTPVECCSFKLKEENNSNGTV